MKKFILVLLALVTCFISLSSVKAQDLDRINYYEVTINPNMDDGTLKVHTKILWEVLDSTSEGPLSWVKIGVPNCFVDDLKAISNSISDISYMSDDGSFIRLDLNKDYYRGDIVTLEYEYIQKRMYILDGDYVTYNYNPGYFDSIIVENCVLKWNKSLVDGITESYSSVDNNYYIYTKRLTYGDRINISVIYDKGSFTSELSEKEQYSDRSTTTGEIIVAICMISLFFLVLLFFIFIGIYSEDPYLENRGFIMHHHIYHHVYFSSGRKYNGTVISPPSSGSSGSAHSSGGFSCACACACAGGGRAGCSKKDYYHTNLKSDLIIKDNKNE